MELKNYIKETLSNIDRELKVDVSNIKVSLVPSNDNYFGRADSVNGQVIVHLNTRTIKEPKHLIKVLFQEAIKSVQCRDGRLKTFSDYKKMNSYREVKNSIITNILTRPEQFETDLEVKVLTKEYFNKIYINNNDIVIALRNSLQN